MNINLLRGSAVAAVVAASALLSSSLVWAEDDPNLDQTITEDQPIVHGQQVLTAGHVDIGPRFDAGQWRLLIHDDAARSDGAATSVWRYPGETVLQVADAAQLPVPDDPAYAFVGAEPGSSVWVIPQTQHPEVVWVGWNTQDPEVMQLIDRGVTMSLTGVDGPGTLTMYLQSGSFEAPDLLWDSRVAEAQPIWVDVNTHTHANWVFTQPGIYLVEVTVTADLLDGSTVTDTQQLRFAVGSDTDVESAFALGSDTDQSTDETPDDDEAAVSGGVSARPRSSLPIVLAGAAVLLIGAVIAIVAVRSSRTKRRVLAERIAAAADAASAETPNAETPATDLPATADLSAADTPAGDAPAADTSAAATTDSEQDGGHD